VPDDPCRTCLCDGGIAVACAVMQCSQPECDHWQRIEGECCSVKCIQTSVNNSTGDVSFDGFSVAHSMLGRLQCLLHSADVRLVTITNIVD